MKNLIYMFVIVLVVGTLNAQWVQVPSGTLENLNDIQFVDANTGFAVGNGGVVLTTTNGGNNWAQINTGSSFDNISLFFLNSNTGYISNSNQRVLFTANNGANWTTLNAYNFSINSMYFLDQLTGYSTSGHNYVALFKTTNSGNNWFTCYSGGGYCKSVRFINSTFGYAISCNKIVVTHDAGSNWSTYIVYDSYTCGLKSAHFITTTIGYTVGDSGKVYKTINGGNNWVSQNSNASNNLNSVKAIDLNKVLIVGNSGIIKSTSNGGATWFTQNSPTQNNLNSLYMVNASTGFIAGDVGTILKTTNGGVWVKKIDEIIPQHYELEQNYPNPFNPSTTIRFSIPKQDFVKITIYNVNGKIISNLIENILTAGTYETTFDASDLSSGVYFVKFNAGKTSITKKISFIK